MIRFSLLSILLLACTSSNQLAVQEEQALCNVTAACRVEGMLCDGELSCLCPDGTVRKKPYSGLYECKDGQWQQTAFDCGPDGHHLCAVDASLPME